MVKPLVDYHIHTGEPFMDQTNPHATGSWADYFLKTKGLNILPGNANHPPHYFGKKEKNLYPFERDSILRGHELWEFFLETNLHFRENHPEALLGLEVDFFPGIDPDLLLEAITTGYLSCKKTHNRSSLSPKNQILKKNLRTQPLDYVILSNHFVFGRPFDYDSDEFNKIKEETHGELKPIFEQYWRDVLALTILGQKIRTQTSIQKVIVGHLDLIKIISLFEKNSAPDVYSSFETTIEKILKNIKAFGLTLEYNHAGIRKGIGAYPGPALFQKAKTMGIPFSFGSDAHSANDYPCFDPRMLPAELYS